MPTIQVEAKVSPSDLLRAVEQLTPAELDQFLPQVLALRAHRRAPALSETETNLLLQINKGLPDDLRDRYEVLRASRDAQSLTPAEHAEIIGLGEQIEKLEADRLKALAELAQLRKTSLSDLMHTLGIEAPT